MHKLIDILGDGSLPTPYEDADLLLRHQAAGHNSAKIIYLSLGETWSQAAPGLRKTLAADLPAHCHGYILSPYGLPALHRTLRTYITHDHSLTDVAVLGADYEVAVSQNSTRNAMFHFGRLLLEDTPSHGDNPPIAIATAPGWDYPGVYAALGYTMRHFTLSPENHYQPDPEEAAELLRQTRRDTAGPVLMIVNAQHNPTGANWDARSVRAMIRAALGTGVSLLIDDAYYAVHNPDLAPTNALRILMEELRTLPRSHHPRWLAVRSLGKQFHCNGWGIGALAASPDTVTQLLAHLLPQYTYVSATPLQAAMANWINNPSSTHYLSQQRADYMAKRAEITRRLTHDLGYPDTCFFPGQCATYMLLRIPPWYDAQSPTTDYRQYCLSRSGVLLGEAHMTTPGHRLNQSRGYVRLYLGPPQQTITQALDRMQEAGLTWHQ